MGPRGKARVPYHNRRSIRLPGYDYGQPGAYFDTICTHRRGGIFGEVIRDRVRLSRMGTIADFCLRDVPRHFPAAEIRGHVVMPNHMHAIVILEGDVRRGVPWNAPTILPASWPASPHQGGPSRASISPAAGTLGVIVRAYKAAVTTRARGAGLRDRVWQRGFYEHVIRDEDELIRLEEYIRDNPIRWGCRG